MQRPPALQQPNKQKENLVNETIYTKNPCWGVGYYWDLINDSVLGGEPIIQAQRFN